jgi:hypothetical protein
MGNSFYTQLAPYLLLEYTYGDQSTTYLSSQVKLARITNDYLDGQVQFLNTSTAQTTTQNVLDTSAANLGGYRWAFLDKDVPVPYINTDPKLVYTDLSGATPPIFVATFVKYDRVRIHLLSGYRLEDIQGLLAQVYVKEAQTSKIAVFANNVYLNSDDRDILNSRPILMGDRMYDRYFEFLVPSLNAANQDFFANPTNPVSIGYQYSSNNRGFLYDSAIYVKVFEISSIEKKNGNIFLNTADDFEINVNQQDVYSQLSANIIEATDGDYFQYYPTFAGNFIEDFIADLNASGGDYVVLNDLDVYEQVGLEEISTYSFTQAQLGGFNAPLEFRPLLKYADSAVTFSIDYTVRIYNRENGFQIIRRSSVTSFNPRKYGKNIEKIALAQQSFPMKVYNKVYNGNSVTFAVPSQSSNFSTVYIPVFYDSKNIVIQTKSVLAEGADPLNPNFGIDSIYFGQGDARLYLSDFDSYVKLSVFQVNSPPKRLDLSASTIQIAFKDTTGNMMKFPALESTTENSKTDGEVVFKIPGYVRQRVLESDTSIGHFYIVSASSGSPDTILYTGSVDNIDNIGKEQKRLSEIATTATSFTEIAATNRTATVTGTVTTVTATTTTAPTTTNNILNPAPTQNNSIIQTLTESNSRAIQEVTAATEETQPVEIPGYSNDTRAESVKKGVTPVSQSSITRSQAEVIARNVNNSAKKSKIENQR